MVRAPRAAVAVVLLLLAGCGPAEPNAAESGATRTAQPLDRGIEKYDFGNATWHSDLGSVRLHDGYATTGSGVGRANVDITAGPYFADLDGDHDEDAAIALRQGAQGFTTAWYVWTWRDDTAHQVTAPFFDAPRCGSRVARIRPVHGGFRVRELRYHASDSCARGGSEPVEYTVGIRDGFVVQTEPSLGPVPVCNPAEFNGGLKVPNTVTLRAAPSRHASVVGTVRAGTMGRMAVRRAGGEWGLLLVERAGGPPRCGYVPVKRLA